MLAKTLILVTLFVFCKGANHFKDPVFRNDYKYSEEANGWFKLHFRPMTWREARLQCFYEGALLASPLNEQMQAGIAKYLQYKGVHPNVMFSGVHAIFAAGIYQSLEGVYLEDMPIVLAKGEPKRSDGCLVFLRDGTMRSESCDYVPHRFICYKKYEKLVLNECGTVDNEYRRVKGTKKCYKYHPEVKNWESAFRICKSEGAWLSTLAERDYQQMEGSVNVAVGYKFVDGIWWDVHGNRKDPNQKTGRGSNECGSRNPKGEFLPAICNHEHSFICEKTAVNIQ